MSHIASRFIRTLHSCHTLLRMIVRDIAVSTKPGVLAVHPVRSATSHIGKEFPLHTQTVLTASAHRISPALDMLIVKNM